MAGEWKTVALGDVAGTRNGAGIKQDFFSLTGVPLARVSDFTDWSIDISACVRVDAAHAKNWEGHRLNEGDAVVATVGSWPPNWSSVVGKAVRVPHTAAGAIQNQNTCCVFARPGITDQRFLFYLLRSKAFAHHAANAAAGSANQARLPVANLARFMFALPTLPEQQAIAHILGTLDDKIELSRRMNETLEAMARALFTSWFVDFDPVRAKAKGRDPGLPKPLADLFPDSFEESELGETPKGWEVKSIEGIAARVGMGPFGSSIKVNSFVPEGIPVISGQHLRGFMVEDTTFNYVSSHHAEKLKAANVQRGDVVFTHAGNIGQVAYVPETSRYERYVISQRQFFMRCDPARVTPIFVVFYFRSAEGQHRLLANASSSGVPSIARPVTYLRSIPLTLPPKPIIDTFERLVEPLLARFRRNLDEGNNLAAVRDTLLPKLIAGDLRVKDAETAVAAAV